MSAHVLGAIPDMPLRLHSDHRRPSRGALHCRDLSKVVFVACGYSAAAGLPPAPTSGSAYILAGHAAFGIFDENNRAVTC